MLRTLLLLLFSVALNAQNQAPVITYMSVNADWNTGFLSVLYDVSDAENDPLQVSVFVSNNGGVTYDIPLPSATGHVGFPVTPGNLKSIQASTADLANMGSQFRFKLVVDDLAPFDYSTLVNEVDSTRLRADLEFVEGIRHRTTGLPHLLEVRDSMENLIKSLDLGLSEHGFSYAGYAAKNILGHQTGTNQASKVVIVDAHYDTVNNAPGADDNGSGTVGVWEAARILSRYPTKKTLRYIGFDLEEAGLIGSNRYINVGGLPATDQVEGVFNFEMIGYYSDVPNSQELPQGFNLLFPDVVTQLAADQYRGNFITNVANTNSQQMALLFSTSAQNFVPDLKVVTLVIPGNGSVAPDLMRSDHAPFWLSNRRALMLTDGAEFRNECYHTPSDTLNEKLDFRFMSNVVKATVVAAAQLAEIQHGDWAITNISAPSGVNDLNDRCRPRVWQDGGMVQLQSGDCPLSGRALWFDAQGKMVGSENISIQSGEMHAFNLPAMPAGTYWLRIPHAKGVWNEKVVIVR
ncbi:MAG: M28 family peptidase [Saprospiraceae bacterium]|nr:M28 family peptidase [Saprospiraceae bacterium]